MLKINPDFAEICGIHAGDGYLRDDGKRRELDISGSLEEKDYYDNHVIPLFEKAFNLEIEGRPFPHRKTYGFVVRNNEEVINTLTAFGFPLGKKSLTVKIPQAILESRNLDMIYRFIRGLFDTDGCLTFDKKYSKRYCSFKRTREYYPRILFSTISKYLFDDLRCLLNKTGFFYHTKQYLPRPTNPHVAYHVCLSGKNNLERWVDNIGFKNPSKLSRYLIWKEFGFCPRNTSLKQRSEILNNELDPNTFYDGPVC